MLLHLAHQPAGHRILQTEQALALEGNAGDYRYSASGGGGGLPMHMGEM
jgi:hypothetical protein